MINLPGRDIRVRSDRLSSMKRLANSSFGLRGGKTSCPSDSGASASAAWMPSSERFARCFRINSLTSLKVERMAAGCTHEKAPVRHSELSARKCDWLNSYARKLFPPLLHGVSRREHDHILKCPRRASPFCKCRYFVWLIVRPNHAHKLWRVILGLVNVKTTAPNGRGNWFSPGMGVVAISRTDPTV